MRHECVLDWQEEIKTAEGCVLEGLIKPQLAKVLDTALGASSKRIAFRKCDLLHKDGTRQLDHADKDDDYLSPELR